ncbi:hypothetical protein [Nioella nitratireducens]|uniref:hypothetical protein n=1 Tax=Nioella nitratireducens TaxID=1287720 RepID=UPI0008FD0362|nr:hypothetical protein [Nioella nitratireducens]
MDPLALALPLAIFCAVYAILTGLSWLRRFIGEKPARRGGMGLNLVRRAVPPVVAGGIVLVAGRVWGLADAAPLAGFLIAGGLGFGFHTGLADLNRPNWRELALRGALTLAFSLFLLNQIGLI